VAALSNLDFSAEELARIDAIVGAGGLRFAESHPSRKNKNAARVGHPRDWIPRSQKRTWGTR